MWVGMNSFYYIIYHTQQLFTVIYQSSKKFLQNIRLGSFVVFIIIIPVTDWSMLLSEIFFL
jgi:hypothetical protein